MGVPFEISDVHAGFSEVKGTLRIEGEFLVFDFQVITMGMFKQPPEVVKIEISALSDARLEKRIVRDRIFIRPKTYQLIDAIPGKHLGDVKLKVWRKYRPSSINIVDEIVYELRRQRRRATMQDE